MPFPKENKEITERELTEILTSLREELPVSQSLLKMDKRTLNKLMRDLVKEADIAAGEILELTTPKEIIEVSRGFGVPLSTKEEQLKQALEIIKEYQEKYTSKEELARQADRVPHLSIILETWEYYENLLRREGRL